MRFLFLALLIFVSFSQVQAQDASELEIKFKDLSKEAQKAIKPAITGLCDCLDQQEEKLTSVIKAINKVLDDKSTSMEDITAVMTEKQADMMVFNQCMNEVEPDGEDDKIMKAETQRLSEELGEDGMQVTFAIIEAGLKKYCKKNAQLFMDFFGMSMKIQARMMEEMQKEMPIEEIEEEEYEEDED